MASWVTSHVDMDERQPEKADQSVRSADVLRLTEQRQTGP
jgi:hypothetical protein